LQGGQWDAGISGLGLKFTGSNHATIPVSPTLDVTTFTLSLWFNSETTGIVPLVESAEPGQRVGFHTWLNTPGYLQNVPGTFQVNLGMHNGAWKTFATGGGLFSPNAWNHLALNYDASTGEAKLYLNKQLIKTALLGVGAVPSFLSNLYLGWRPDYSPEWGSNLHFAGRMDEIRIYNAALGESEVAALFDRK
jgi:hypothetical protein